MTKTSGFTRTPTLMIVATFAVVGVIIIASALAQALWAEGDTAVLMTVGLGATGGLLLGSALSMERHRRAMAE